LTRAAKLTLVQYILILAFSYPAFLFLRTSTAPQSGAAFLTDSFLFRNQIGLLHILPLFIAFSILSPILLFFVARRLDALLIAASVVTFWLGYGKPDLFRYGAPAVFPIAQWQIYFVAGLLFGVRAHRRARGMMVNRPGAALAALACLALVVVLRYGEHLGMPAEYLPLIVRFPLAPGGALLGLTMAAMLVCASSLAWPFIARTWLADEVRLFGRSSLLVFAIHVGFAKLIEVLMGGFGSSVLIAYALIAANLVCCHAVLAWTESAPATEAPWAARSLKYLFG
jgi:hypothetical protein